MDRLEGAGLTAAEAFLVATRRVGAPAAVAQEFAKTHPEAVWLRRLAWMVGGYLAMSVTGNIVSLCSRLLIAVGISLGVPGPWLAVASSVLSLTLSVAIFFLAWHFGLRGHSTNRIAQRLQQRPGSTAILVGSAVVLGHLLVSGGDFLAMRTASARDYGTWFAYCWNISALFQHLLLWPVFFGWVLWRLSRAQGAEVA